MKTLTVNIAGLKMLGEQGLLKDFAVFISFKRIYSSGTVYAKSYRKLAAKLNTSVHSVKKYIPKFITLGWCRWHSDNLVFNSVKLITAIRGGRYKKVDWVATPKKIFQQFSELILKSLEDGLEWAKRLRRELNEPTVSNTRKNKIRDVLDEIGKKERELPTEKAWLKLSVNRFSKKLGVSAGTAHASLKKMRTDGLLRCRYKREVVGNFSRSNVNRACRDMGGAYVVGSCVFTVKCNEYKFAKN